MYVLDTNILIYYFKHQGQVAYNLALIAGIAIALQSTLVTHNVNKFSRVAGLTMSTTGYAYADWY
ncbi:hypothetical protein [Nostoc sp.]|uniref:hypothetical protein n=1 Tax=Nostoc sp. TaxID=1180 RepID=UPI002FFCEFCB